MVRTSILIQKLECDLTKLDQALVQSDDALIKVGLNDLRLVLEELDKIIAEPKAGEECEVRRSTGRDASGLIFEISHDLDEVVMGIYTNSTALADLDQDDEWRARERGRAAALIEIGLGDARRDLEELRNLIVKPEASEEKEASV